MSRRGTIVMTAAVLSILAFPLRGSAEDDTMQKGQMGKGGMGHMGGMEGQAGGTHGGAQTHPMADMPRRMQEMREHSQMMDGIEDPERLRAEMRRHMKMMDDMMEKMMEHATSSSSQGSSPSQGMGGDM